MYRSKSILAAVHSGWTHAYSVDPLSLTWSISQKELVAICVIITFHRYCMNWYSFTELPTVTHWLRHSRIWAVSHSECQYWPSSTITRLRRYSSNLLVCCCTATLLPEWTVRDTWDTLLQGPSKAGEARSTRRTLMTPSSLKKSTF